MSQQISLHQAGEMEMIENADMLVHSKSLGTNLHYTVRYLCFPIKTMWFERRYIEFASFSF